MIRDRFRRIRATPEVNAAIRKAVRLSLNASSRLASAAATRWPVAGDVPLELHGVRFRLHNECDDHVATRLFYGAPHEPYETRLWTILCPHARVILDVGANTGLYSVLAGVQNPGARIVSFEPHPTNYARLTRNVELNALTNVQTERLAVGDSVGTIEFSIPENEGISLVSSAVGAFSEAFFDIRYKQVRVPQTSLDAYLAEHRLGPVDLLVLDVEYYELQVLRGAERLLREDKPVIIGEVFNYDVLAGDHPSLRNRIDPDHAANIERLLTSFGYALYSIGPNGLLRVRDLHSVSGGDSNYLFSPNTTAPAYIPYHDTDAIAALLPRARRSGA